MITWVCIGVCVCILKKTIFCYHVAAEAQQVGISKTIVRMNNHKIDGCELYS